MVTIFIEKKIPVFWGFLGGPCKLTLKSIFKCGLKYRNINQSLNEGIKVNIFSRTGCWAHLLISGCWKVVLL